MTHQLNTLNQGINGTLIGLTMKECARRAMAAIRAHRFNFEATKKGFSANGRQDWVTNADILAQKIYTKLLREAFPNFGIVGEEDELSIPCSIEGENIYFTVDPLDGTKAFTRKQSYGVATMCSLVWNDTVIAVCIGDVLTGEFYYFRPQSKKVHRISENGFASPLAVQTDLPLSEQNILLRETVESHPIGLPSFICPSKNHENNLFKGTSFADGSIGLSMARLWKGEVGGAILLSNKQTPWDMNPIVGMNNRLGFKTFEIGYSAKEIMLPPSNETYETTSPLLFIHESRVEEFKMWCKDHDVSVNML